MLGAKHLFTFVFPYFLRSFFNINFKTMKTSAILFAAAAMIMGASAASTECEGENEIYDPILEK